VAAATLASVVSLGAVDAAYADIAGLTPCTESKAFAKLQKTEVKKLEKRKKLVRSLATSEILCHPELSRDVRSVVIDLSTCFFTFGNYRADSEDIVPSL
jgi:hypothetical protein